MKRIALAFGIAAVLAVAALPAAALAPAGASADVAAPASQSPSDGAALPSALPTESPAAIVQSPAGAVEQPLDFLDPLAGAHAACSFTTCTDAFNQCRSGCNDCPVEFSHCSASACVFNCICHWELC